MIRTQVFTLALLLALSFAPVSQACNFGGFGARFQFPGNCGPRRAPTYAERYYYSNSAYPKYYYGFHANYMQSIGLPPGDIGLRSYGIQWSPW